MKWRFSIKGGHAPQKSGPTTGPLSPPQGRPLSSTDSEALRLWYDEALRARSEAQGMLDELRARAGTFLTVIALTTTFLITLSTTRNSQPIPGRPWELAALCLFVLSVFAVSVVLMPYFRWHFYARPGLLRRMVERGVSADEIMEHRARRIPKQVNPDTPKIERLQWLLILGIFAFLAEVICWAVNIL